jgi:hypothetical protein
MFSLKKGDIMQIKYWFYGIGLILMVVVGLLTLRFCNSEYLAEEVRINELVVPTTPPVVKDTSNGLVKQRVALVLAVKNKHQKVTTCIPDGKTCGAILTRRDVN